jgi:methylated-DNA-[protein]-cysteine S-methyltransferase
MPPTVHVAAVDAPWGPVHLAAWDRGLVACDSMTPLGPFVEGLERRLRVPVVERGHPVLDAAVEQVAAFLADRRRAFELPIDLSDRPAWDQAVLRAVADVPWGAVATYGQIARAIDRAGAARAVGGAVARSPIGIIVPCHRIVAADGTLGGYGGDGGIGFGSREQHLRLKRELLLREGVDIPLPPV